MRFHSFDDVQDHLDALGLFHMDFGLDRMRNALDALGLLTPPFVTVQIVGTNGKGSTSTFLSCVARAHGLKVGLYTSPHFVTPRERIRINGTMLPADRWPVLADRVMEAAPNLTYFEFLTALGLLAFAEAGVDLVVMEAGLGGHYDATTAMPVQAVCFTPIGMDHEKILGPTLTDIASDKSQAMRPGVPAFTAPQEAEALDCLLRTAQEKGTELRETATLPFPQSSGSPGRTSASMPGWPSPYGTGSPISTIGPICPKPLPRGWLPRTSPDGSSASRPATACRP